MEKDGSLLDDYILSLLEHPRPKVCFLPTASGDADHYVVRFYRRFSPDCEASHVSLFRRDQGTGGVEDDLAAHLLSQDLIYVGGGNMVSHARRLAGPRPGLDPAPRLAPGDRHVRSLGRLAVLVRRGPQRLPRRAPARSGPGPAALLQLRPLRRRARPPRGVPPCRRRRDDGRFRRRGRSRPAFPGHQARAGRQLAPRRPGLSGAAEGRAASARPAWTPSTSAARRRRRRHAAPAHRASATARRAGRCVSAAAPRAARGADDLCDGRRRLHDGARQPAARRLRPLAGHGQANRRSCSCPPPRATRRRRSTPSKPASPAAPASPSTSPCSVCARPSVPLAELVAEQDILYVGGGSMRNLLAIWRAHELDDDADRSLGTRHRPCRPQRGRDVLVPVGPDPLQRAARTARGPRPARGLADRPRRRRARAAAGLAGAPARRHHARRLGPR